METRDYIIFESSAPSEHDDPTEIKLHFDMSKKELKVWKRYPNGTHKYLTLPAEAIKAIAKFNVDTGWLG